MGPAREHGRPEPVSAPATAGDPAARRLVKRSVTLAGHRTSISLEAAFWTRLRRLAEARGRSVNALVAEIDAARTASGGGSLSGALRVWVLEQVDRAQVDRAEP